MSEKIRWGILGCAAIARVRTIPGLLEADNAEEYIMAAVESMQKLGQSPIRDYDYIPEDEPV